MKKPTPMSMKHGAIAETSLRWISNILVEVLSNSLGPHYPKTAAIVRLITQALYEAQTQLQKEIKEREKIQP